MQGKKTYAAAILALVTVWLSFWTGDVALAEAIQVSVTAVLGATLRHGIATSQDKT